MEELLQRLEKRIKELVNQHDQLRDSNLQLHQGRSLLAREKDALLAKQQKAISQIETLVSRLKAIEKKS
ncbi:MAG: TIGR02449 family protein [Gammaproteobacteria bacterium]|nr:TIGR02449 family protein [Gammaproteobacteria bacterium]MCW5582646.1 TIGR02449 family protein [Gammaproteobacteria bacterium]